MKFSPQAESQDLEFCLLAFNTISLVMLLFFMFYYRVRVSRLQQQLLGADNA
ncbi:hypothetical protein BOX15_Mlig016762g1 [Macrostomum lignano]|uniref:Uncharacterized protein n=1 Tax=Macrostomum lignano TaxID=282301 RepID=A0A267FZZ3_9PLAT|nr:hypothetical protein BOX15_Mlig022858g1 [Macrostomum lignano]PAA79400.1 hypothetical protein BOX15_Mlig016762g1 [Macrostomum lignano]